MACEYRCDNHINVVIRMSIVGCQTVKIFGMKGLRILCSSSADITGVGHILTIELGHV